WERRFKRKHRRRSDDGASSPKRRRLAEEAVRLFYQAPWQQGGGAWAPQLAAPPLQTAQQAAAPGQGVGSPPRAAPEPEAFSMEVEARVAAVQRLQEIEDRITLEDDDEDDLETESADRKPVLVISDSLREGLQRGIADIIPKKVVESMNHLCMELVLWRPPPEVLPRRLKDSMQRVQQLAASSSKEPLLVKNTDTEAQQHRSCSMLYTGPGSQAGMEEDVEM
uniref:Coiled-coil domain containing 117 n=1 Tax=Lepisosteus oculatus TaxID=7918 RepID=W5MMZ4_LEPOC